MQQTITTHREKTLQLVLMAMMVALIFIFSRFLGINTDYIHIGFDFLPALFIACLYGPVWGAVTYMVGDLVCAIGMPLGAINPGITIVAGIIGAIYGFAFYKRNLQGKKLMIVTVITSLIVAGIVKTFGTTLCLSIMYGSPYWATLVARIPSCAIICAIQIITIPLIYKYAVVPIEKILNRR